MGRSIHVFFLSMDLYLTMDKYIRITKHKATDSGIELTPKLPSLNDTQQSCIVVDTPGSVVTDMLTAINT